MVTKEEITSKKFFNVLEKERTSLGISQETISKIIGVQSTTYSSWRSGKIPSSTYITQIKNGCFALQVLRVSGLLPTIENKSARERYFKGLAFKSKLHTLIKFFA